MYLTLVKLLQNGKSPVRRLKYALIKPNHCCPRNVFYGKVRIGLGPMSHRSAIMGGFAGFADNASGFIAVRTPLCLRA